MSTGNQQNCCHFKRIISDDTQTILKKKCEPKEFEQITKCNDFVFTGIERVGIWLEAQFFGANK